MWWNICGMDAEGETIWEVEEDHQETRVDKDEKDQLGGCENTEGSEKRSCFLCSLTSNGDRLFQRSLLISKDNKLYRS